jgi:hypothetical protein
MSDAGQETNFGNNKEYGGRELKACPRCGEKFNILQRAVGEYKEHLRHCTANEEKKDLSGLAAHCRGCPAGCFENIECLEKK